MTKYLKNILLSALLSATASTGAMAFDASKDTTYAKEVVITGTRTPVLFQESGRSLELINKSTLERSVSNNIELILKQKSSIDLRQRGASGTTADLGIRGGNHDQTLVMLNGIKMNNMQTGHHNLDLPIDLESITKIEVLSGGASRVLGPNAFAGAVNFITGGDDTFYSNVNLSAGMHNYYALQANANVPIGDTGIFLAVNKKKSDGYRDNTDFDLLNLFSTIDYDSYIGHFYLDLGYNKKAYGANSFYSAAYPDQFETTNSTFTALRYSTGTKIRINANVFFREHNDRYELFRHGLPAPAWYKHPNYHQTRTYGYEVKASLDYLLGTTSLGVEYRNENLLSNNIGIPLLEKDYVKVPKEGNAVFTKSGVRNSANFYLEHNAHIGDISISAGALFNQTTAFDANLYPGIDLAYHLTDNFSIYSSYNKSLRFASFTDLYYNIPTQQGDPNLKPEEAQTLELGTKYLDRAMQFNVSAFYRNGKNMIDWVKKIVDGKPEEGKYKSMNIAEINAIGLEASLAMNMLEIWNSQKFFTNASLSYAYIDMRSEDKGNYISAYVLDNLKHKFVATASFALPFEINLHLNGVFEERNGHYIKYENKVAGELTKYEPHFIMNAKITKDIWNFTLALDAFNVLDKQYVDIGNLIQPGREIRFTLGYRFR